MDRFEVKSVGQRVGKDRPGGSVSGKGEVRGINFRRQNFRAVFMFGCIRIRRWLSSGYMHDTNDTAVVWASSRLWRIL